MQKGGEFQISLQLKLSRNCAAFYGLFTSCRHLRLLFSQAESELSEVKGQAKMIFRRMNRNSAPEASIESGKYNLQ